MKTLDLLFFLSCGNLSSISPGNIKKRKQPNIRYIQTDKDAHLNFSWKKKQFTIRSVEVTSSDIPEVTSSDIPEVITSDIPEVVTSDISEVITSEENSSDIPEGNGPNIVNDADLTCCCADLIVPLNGSLGDCTDGRTVGETCRFDCNEGYILSRLSSMSCDSNGFWKSDYDITCDINLAAQTPAPLELDHCESGCDSDDDCLRDLKCFHREAKEPIPGCQLKEEQEEEAHGHNFCINAMCIPAEGERRNADRKKECNDILNEARCRENASCSYAKLNPCNKLIYIFGYCLDWWYGAIYFCVLFGCLCGYLRCCRKRSRTKVKNLHENRARGYSGPAVE